MKIEKNKINHLLNQQDTKTSAETFAENMRKPTTWITTLYAVEDFSEELIEVAAAKVQNIIVFGAFHQGLKDLFDAHNIQLYFNKSMEEAVRMAFYASEPGSVVLFSPGTITGGEYTNYRERGEHFKNAIAQL